MYVLKRTDLGLNWSFLTVGRDGKLSTRGLVTDVVMGANQGRAAPDELL